MRARRGFDVLVIRSFNLFLFPSACVRVGVIVRLGALCVQQAAWVQLRTG